MIFGELAERFKAHAWKACIPQKGIKGSNPLLSALLCCLVGEFLFLTAQSLGQTFLTKII